MAAAGHMPMADEVLSNTFAHHAFENFEIASCMALITMAEAAGHSRFVPALREALGEEQRRPRPPMTRSSRSPANI
jgi:ferritin-like metal-binding protein YciE